MRFGEDVSSLVFLANSLRGLRRLQSLRVVRRSTDRISADGSLRLPAADPLNLVGIVTPGTRVSALSGTTVEVLGPAAADDEARIVGAAASWTPAASVCRAAGIG